MLKRMISMLLVLAVIFSFLVPVTASSGLLTIDAMREELLSKGIPEDFLNSRSDTQITELYQTCHEKNIEFGGSETSYWVNGETVINTRAAIPTYDMKLEISTLYYVDTDVDGYSSVYRECYVYVYYEWTSPHPLVRKYDAIAVNWDPSIWSYKGEFQHVDYSDKWTSYSSTTRPTECVQGGLGYYAYLSPLGSTLVGDTRFTLVPSKTPMYPSGSGQPGFTSTINVNYVHDKNPLPIQGVSFSVDGVGIGITFGGLADEAAASFSGRYSWVSLS